MKANVSDMLLHLQNEVLEAIAYGEALESIGRVLCERAEVLAPGAICSILTVDRDGRLHPLASPSLPTHYSNALDGLPIGPDVGSCGTAAYLGQPVNVTDIATDPLWAKYKTLPLPLGLKSCWSSPITARDGRVVGTFAFYHRTNIGPTQLEERIVSTCLHLCTIAMEHKEVQDRNHRLAYFDTLTDLPNRGHFNQLLRTRITNNRPFGLLFVDIDHLKSINDTMGHVFGDVFIRTLAGRIGAADPAMPACRMGGDEFALLVDNCASDIALQAAAEKVLASAAGLIEVGHHTVSPSVTIGGALFGRDGSDAETLYQNADFALYHAKEKHRGGFVPFRTDLRSAMIENINLVSMVDKALDEGRMLAHYQPIVRLDTGEIVGLEALARLRTEDGTIIAAGQFQPALADPRIAYRLTDCMLAEVAADIRNWLDQGLPIQHVGINVTTGDFQRGDLKQRIVSTFEAARVPLKHIILEVNEAVYMGGTDRMVAKAVEDLRNMGVLAALDDFGTGFASLTHLLSFPIDVIKIDKSFVDRIATDAPSAVIVGGIIDIARKLNMRIVAEGVETAVQAAFLADLGCSLGQGYLFSRPCGAADVTTLLGAFAQGVKTPMPAAAAPLPIRRLRAS
ncbi:EAL domain-containing protein [Devosia sp.]|uniref:bifunctional diguanylate cyclase/phosphodiesterase n=1 Tax=Devosia sp. TaxID=1871048 RepID=UPI0032648A66